MPYGDRQLVSSDRAATLILKGAACIAAALIPILAGMLFLSAFLQSGDSPSFPTASAVIATRPAVHIPASKHGAQFADAGTPQRLYIARHYHPYVKPPKPPAPPAPVQAPAPVQPAGSPQQYAISLLGAFGWSSSEFSCLNSLWTRESSWNYQATNPYSGAYGIPQALPGSKMATAGADWATNPATQIKWGLGYIKAVYGSPCGAWDHEMATGAY